jgi:hypothetical protein
LEPPLSVIRCCALYGCAIFVTLSSQARSEEIKLKCWDSSGRQTVDWTLDLEARRLVFGTPYQITALTDLYVTAVFLNTQSVGGEVLVLNRVTGDYKRASIFMTGPDPDASVLRESTHTGKCSRQQF